MIVYICIYDGSWDEEYAACASHERAKDWAFGIMRREADRAIRSVDNDVLERAIAKRDLDQAIHLWDRFTDGEQSFIVVAKEMLDHTVEEKLECKSG